MPFTKPLHAKLLAATASLALIAGCDASLMSGAGLPAASYPGAGGQNATVRTPVTNANAPRTNTAPVVAAKPVSSGTSLASPVVADSAALEADVEAYNAIAAGTESSDPSLPAMYAVTQFDDPAENWAAPDQAGRNGGSGGYARGGYGQGSYGQGGRGDNDGGYGQGGYGGMTAGFGGRGAIVFVPRITVVVLPGSRFHYTPVAARPAFKHGRSPEVRKQAAPVQQTVTRRDSSRLPTAEEQAVKSLLGLAHWNHDASDSSLLVKEASMDLSHTDGKGNTVSRKIHLKRTIKADTRELIAGVTDLSETLSDGSANTVHWEKTLQDDGSYDVVFHHEHKLADGSSQVTDWEKLVAANGDITGKGVTTLTDKDGKVLSSQTIDLGGNEADQQTIATNPASPSPTPSPSATTDTTATSAASASPTPSPSATASTDTTATTAASPTPGPSASASTDANATATASVTTTTTMTATTTGN